MSLLNRKGLLQKEKLEVTKIELDKDNFIYVRQMTGHERDAFERSLMKETKDEKTGVVGYERSIEDFRAKLAVMTVCDEKGELILESGDYETLSNNMSAKKLEKIINVAQKLNAISEEDKEALVKNSSAGLGDNSNSGSAEN